MILKTSSGSIDCWQAVFKVRAIRISRRLRKRRVCGCRGVAIVGAQRLAQRVVQRGWCRKRMQPRWVPVSTWGRNSTRRRRTNQQREEQQQKRTAGGKVSPRETLPPESVMGAAQHRTLGAAPRRASGRESTCRSATRGKSRSRGCGRVPTPSGECPTASPAACQAAGASFRPASGWAARRAARRAGRAATFEPATSTHRSSGYSKMVCCTGVCGLAGCRAANLSTGGRGAGGCARVHLAEDHRRPLNPALNSPPEERAWRPPEGRHLPNPPARPPSVEQRACRPSRRRRPSA